MAAEAGLDSAPEFMEVPPSPSIGLSQKMRRGVMWTAASRLGTQVIQFASLLALARILAPEDFGVATVTATVTGFAAIFVELGFGTALVQRRELNERVLATAFWLNLALGVSIAALLSLLAPLFATFFGQPSLAYLVPIASLSFVLSFNVVQTSILRREMDFRRLGFISVVNVVVTAVVGISGALAGWGALALVVAGVAATAANTAQSWMYVRWRPRTLPKMQEARSLWLYSRGLLGYSTVNYWSRNADSLLIGKVLGAAALGYYARAYNLMLLPVGQMRTVLTTVLFPALSRAQEDGRRFSKSWLMATKAAWLAGTPMAAGMAVTAPALVEVLLGERWLTIVPVLVLLSCSIPAQLLGVNTGPVFQARAKTGLQFRLGLASSGITVACMAAGLPFGIVGVATGYLVASWFAAIIPLLPALRLADVRLSDLLRAISYSTACTVVMAGVVAITPAVIPKSSVMSVVLGAQVTVGLIVYLALLAAGERRFIRELMGWK
ncbi:lipopolysaccharide biosynthesis protein [Modestobacter sp. VKM Ac-2979]|uniref:lipopolysaccharide biosynthesis protein n=1 Tax=unclassified Modestobacter TaxID=2643866 RepID=UPI0022AB720B|nr:MULTISPECIES: lipopolysaccharide biosynthesis protein [unclassified Modestobacter]MCZ2813417.1 lipopolysaccharide biosynthesis protein [Modestobacter sp. VKM Ac-2979]MCZ2842391.1 lipopolysaccharide biosynthesis protein [Modestobacter sp. VKM Ac-2980]